MPVIVLWVFEPLCLPLSLAIAVLALGAVWPVRLLLGSFAKGQGAGTD
jgi:hypothetical protein